MLIIELLLLSIGLAADAFSVSICKGLAAKKAGLREMLCAGAWFGIFQALMPLLGWFLGSAFKTYIEKIDHWIAFVLLVAVGLNMIREAIFSKEESLNASFSPKVMLLLAVATSIDALAVGITFEYLMSDLSQVLLSSLTIGIITFIMSGTGIKIGNAFGTKAGRPAQIAGGILLVLIGVKILLSHMEIIPF